MEKKLEIMEAWEIIKENVKERMELSSISYSAWIAPLEIDEICGRTIYVKTRVKGVEDYIKRKYFRQIRLAIKELLGEDYKLAFKQIDEKGGRK